MPAEKIVRPIAATDLVSDVLARSEALVDVFVRHSPVLDKLRNRAMRRVMARLVTVEQAARMARVPLEPLLRDLNAALSPGASAATAPGAQGCVASASGAGDGARAHPAAATVVELDVRDDLRSGREPFSKIMAAIATLPHGDVLRLRAIFEPVPLFAVLAKRGFAHEARRHADDDWSVWFWREPEGESSAPAPAAAPAPEDREGAADDGTRWLDVRGLEPPEPLVRTLAALETLRVGEQLVQINVRVPQFLLPMLAERGYACEVDESHADRVLVRIWRAAPA
ncbi:MAG: DUF2249 domain-containing protein [Gemmatimonadaceae bacterium]|nr:DUF2249 domain-containing protein [Gemmatimonadaceae bacterium]NUQ94913.1 DUF2249 domain-containing protein [Gemmatimonadaceae bacterium]NUR20380.1 DUF2249 domain-containing protein [Gemmatimonadaceae bacterium]NUS98865.1 DUF2249 domain-containing protein [Gemmatimonadaceae bacterium]